MKDTETKREVEILDEELNLETDTGIEYIWPENYETYICDGLYLENVN